MLLVLFYTQIGSLWSLNEIEMMIFESYKYNGLHESYDIDINL
jgi:hypothetical protein